LRHKARKTTCTFPSKESTYPWISAKSFFELPDTALLLRGRVAAAPDGFDFDGGAHSHEALVGAGNRRDADLRVDVEDGSLAALGVALDADTGEHVVVVLVGRDNVLLEDNLLGAVAREGVASTAHSGLARGERGVALEAGLDDGEPGRCY